MPVKDKKKPSGGEKPLTSFFARAPKGKQTSSPTKATASTPTRSSVASSVASSIVQSTSSSSEAPSKKLSATPLRKVSRKRSHSPESHHPSNSLDQTSVSLMTPKRPYKKKVRLSPRQDPAQRATSLVPSSQSDEEELLTAMSVVEAPQLSLEQRFPSDEQSSPFSSGGTSPIPSSHVSPSPSSSSKRSLNMPTTPVALDATAKTAQLIEQIKQRAYAAVHSSPEPPTLEFNEELDDDSDEEEVPFALTLHPTAKSEIEGPSSRYTLRKRNSSPTQPRKTHNQVTPVLAPMKKKPNPFDSLLKEKKAAERKGVGNEAIRRADAIARDMEQFSSIVDGEEESDDEGVHGTDALNLAIKSKDLFQSKPRRKRANADDDDESRDTGKEIVGILERDVAIKEEDAQLQRPRGIHFWREDCQSIMEVDKTDVVYQFPGESNIANTVNSLIKQGDQDRVPSLLRVDFTTAMSMDDLTQLFESVLDWELAPQCLAINGTMQSTLEHLAPMSLPIFPFHKMLEVLRGLGADAKVLATLNRTIPLVGPLSPISLEDREDAVFRLTTALGLFAKYGKLAMNELPEFVIALLLIALDETSSADNQQDAIQTIDTICNLTDADRTKEIDLCSRILAFIHTLAPSIQCNAVLILAQGSGVSRRLANYIAYCAIVDQTDVDASTYSDKPPIEDIRRQFQRTPGYPAKFVIREDTDYVDLGFYIAILGVAVSDIRGYVSQERHDSKKAQAEIDHSSTKPLVGLKGLRDDLETLHSRISDARATHLERSRTKGCIKALSMSIHYQRELWTKNDAENKSRTLAQYFRKK